ncbi:TIGR03619 family F420-dependent LLM class oxidoreductase [Amycolatopsis vancoresmycina]|uniref:Putative F420-dependent oxidoreductase family protein n=1 Tax=Amycolatopsis vancoresmycina DSM 44592 TaxID=1292037 RepID=R1HNK8_9PSEU|nr:TIGR03619 family F420-dependent LLM class oxidoreductase [Amycolatopsis vancoresmycina]EOD65115.1 putative F420-dependent oxidoreductase family protein [Amycolatopsis vancoresmycina DSM 44592]
MDLEVVLPNEEPDLDPARPAELARLAEDLGYRAAWLPDHVLPPGPFGEVFGGVYEPLVTLAHIAARTSRIRLGTSVLIVPLREPFTLAKQVATLDRLSGHRFGLGVGVGWNEPEFTEVGADFGARGRRTDETLDLLAELLRTGRGPRGGYVEPRTAGPVPVTVGGNSAAALRRAARIGAGWTSAGLSPAEVGERAGRLRAMTNGRETRVTARMEWDGTDLETAVARFRAYILAGADAVAVHFGPAEAFAQRMTAFAEAVAGP